MDHRWVARGLVLGLHLALLGAWWQHQPPPLNGPAERRVTTLRIVPLRPAAPAEARTRPAPRTPAVPAITLPITPPITPATAPAITPAAAPTAPPPEATVTAEPPRSTLRLTLPPGYAASAAAARNPALDDPRSNTPRLTLEDRIADALGGTAGWVEEKTSENRAQSVGALGDRRTVMRRGDTCVEIHRSRIADMDSFNGNVAPRAVAMVGRAYKCK